MPWLVAMTKPNHEAIAAINLQRQGFTHYYPRYAKKLPGKEPVIRPLFPRYIFVAMEQVWRSLTGTRGISYLLMGESGPQVVHDSAIEAIKNRELDGLFQLIPPPRFKLGQAVKTAEGPLAGLPLIYEGMTAHERVRVLANLLGRSVIVTMEERQLAAA